MLQEVAPTPAYTKSILFRTKVKHFLSFYKTLYSLKNLLGMALFPVYILPPTLPRANLVDQSPAAPDIPPCSEIAIHPKPGTNLGSSLETASCDLSSVHKYVENPNLLRPRKSFFLLFALIPLANAVSYQQSTPQLQV